MAWQTGSVEPPTVLLSGKQVQYPQIGLGCASGVRYQHVKSALENGYRLLDTAQAYVWGYNEDDVGRAAADSVFDRGDIYIQTKIHPEDLGYDATLRAFNNSLRRLQTSYVDSLLLHKPRCWAGACSRKPEGTWQDSWMALEKLYDEGLVRAIGICDVDPGIFAELMQKRVKPHVIQNWMDPMHQDKAVRDLCKKHGVVYQAYSTLGTQWRMQIGDNPVMSSPVLARIAAIHQRSVSQVVLRWATQHGVAVIPASRNAGRQAENLRCTDFTLSDDEMAQIDNLEGTARRPSGASRDGKVKLTLAHRLERPVEVLWVDGEREVSIGTIDSGADMSLDTTMGHTFRFRVGGANVDEYVVAKGSPSQRHVIQSQEL